MLSEFVKSRPGFAAFQYREYRIFCIAAGFSNIGMWTLVAGRLWLMHELTDSAIALGLVTLSSLGPILLLSVWGGVLADRVNRLRLVMTTRAMFAALAFLTGVLVATGVIEPWHLIAISLSTGVLLSFDIPSRQAIMPSLVGRKHLAGGIAMYSFVSTGSAIIGPIFFAPLVKVIGIEGLFFIIGGSYVATVAIMAAMKPLRQATGGLHESLLHDLREGLGYVRRNRVVGGLIIMGIVVGLSGASYQTLLPIYAEDALHGDIDDFGGLLLGGGIGAMFGAILLATFGTSARTPTIMLPAGVAFGIALTVLAQVTWLPAAIAAMFFLGTAAALYTTSSSTIVQTSVDDRFRGRVMSIHQWTWGASAFGGLLMGGIASAVDVQFALTVGGIVSAIAVAVIASAALGRRVIPGRPESAVAAGGDQDF